MHVKFGSNKEKCYICVLHNAWVHESNLKDNLSNNQQGPTVICFEISLIAK